MKTLILLLVFSLTATSAYSGRFKSKIYEIDKGSPHIIKMENGRVVFVTSDEDLSLLTNSMMLGETLEIEVSNTNDLIAVETIAPVTGLQFLPTDRSEDLRMSYEPTVVSDSESANAIFKRMRRDYQNESQCYNRAHIWASEEFKKTRLNSIKLFLFFTSRYIRNYRYKWWFHVSPMIKALENGIVVDLVLDRRYTSGPRHIKPWTDNFIYSRRSCPIVSKYSDYRDNQKKEDCYLIPVSMYYWQPRDIARFERTGSEKKSFIRSEINWAYYEAF